MVLICVFITRFKCERELANLEFDAVVKNIGLGYAYSFEPLDGTRKNSMVDDDDSKFTQKSEEIDDSHVSNI